LNRLLVIGGCLILGNALAGGAEILPLPPPSPFPYIPGVSLWGLGGNGWTAIADAMAPVFGNVETFTFIDPQFYYHSDDSEYTGSAGIGQRWLTDRFGIVGAYVFGDYNHSLHSQSFWFVSPGIESLGVNWDFSANLYIPVSSQRKNTGTTFADNVGDFDDITFSGHQQLDELVNTFESTGIGGDAEIGYRIPFYNNTKLFLGGYYFNQKDHEDIGGGFARAEIPVTPFLSAVVSDAYDNQAHNTFKAGLTLWFGARNTGFDFDGNLAQRMVDPIRRNLIALSGSSHTGQPIAQGFEETGQVVVEQDNISFFLPELPTPPGDSTSAAVGDGTFENPYRGMTQDNVDDANLQNNRNFYINSGTYDAMYGSMNPDFIVLNNDQLYGRQSYKGKVFVQAAEGAKRPLIEFSSGGFLIPDTDINDGLTGLQLHGAQNTLSSGILVDHSDPNSPTLTVALNNVSENNFENGLSIQNGSINPVTTFVDNSEFTNNFIGINSDNNGAGDFNLMVNNTNIMNNLVFGVQLFNDTQGQNFNAQFNHDNISGSSQGIFIFDVSQNTRMDIDINFTKIFSNSVGVNYLNQSQGNNNVVTFSHSAVTENNQGIIVSAFGSGGSNNINVYSTSISKNNTIGFELDSGTGDNDLNMSFVGSSFVKNGGNGILILNQSPSAVDLSIKFSQISDNGAFGLVVNNQGGPLDLLVSHSIVSNNGLDGIFLSPNNLENAGIFNATIESSRISGNENNGINVFGPGSIDLLVKNSHITGNTFDGILVTQSSPANIKVEIDKSVIADNGFNGIEIDAANSSIDTPPPIELTINDSWIKRNGENGLFLFATANDSIINFTVNNSLISKNGVNGIFINQSSDGKITGTIDHSTISHNGANGIQVLAFGFTNSYVDLTVNHSSINFNDENGIDFTALLNVPNQLTVSHSAIIGNGANGINFFIPPISPSQSNDYISNPIIDIDHTIIAHNGEDGIFVDNEGSSVIDVEVDNSLIAHNGHAGIELFVPGGALDEIPINPTSLVVKNSVIVKNDIGIQASGPTSTTVFDSVIAFNKTAGLNAFDNSLMDIINPIFFKGLVTAGDNSAITFQTPDGTLLIDQGTSQFVKCFKGQCEIVSNN
jgi:hypothetical protein